MGEVVLPRRAAEVHRGRGRLVPGHPARVARAQAVVGLLRVEEEGLVPRADLLEAVGRHGEHRAERPVDRPRVRVGLRLVDVLRERRDPSPAQAERPQQRRRSAQGQVQARRRSCGPVAP